MKQFQKFICLFFIISLLGTGSISAADKEKFSIAPTTNNGKKWRIGYYEGGPYIHYQLNFIAIIEGLLELGWIEPAKIPPQKGEQTKDLWKWLVANAESEYIQFPANAHYSGDWDKNIKERTTTQIINRLNKENDLDLMIAAGTSAGRELANSKHQTPTIVISTSDPLASGIIKSLEDSGYDHLHARTDPVRFERQVMMFHDIIGFKKLGIAYDNSVIGKSYAAISQVETASQKLGFEIVRCYTIGESETSDVKVAEESLRRCFNQLGETADAIYVTEQFGMNTESISELVEIANSYKLPTFSQAGSEEVQSGILMSISMVNYKYVGVFYAQTIAKIFNGAKPRDLDQLFQDPAKIAINLKTAKTIGFHPPVALMAIAHEIYHEFEKPRK